MQLNSINSNSFNDGNLANETDKSKSLKDFASIFHKNLPEIKFSYSKAISGPLQPASLNKVGIFVVPSDYLNVFSKYMQAQQLTENVEALIVNLQGEWDLETLQDSINLWKLKRPDFEIQLRGHDVHKIIEKMPQFPGPQAIEELFNLFRSLSCPEDVVPYLDLASLHNNGFDCDEIINLTKTKFFSSANVIANIKEMAECFDSKSELANFIRTIFDEIKCYFQGTFSLEPLNLNLCGFDKKAISLLAACMNTAMTQLTLGDDSITGKCVSELIEDILVEMNQLEVLDLKDCAKLDTDILSSISKLQVNIKILLPHKLSKGKKDLPKISNPLEVRDLCLRSRVLFPIAKMLYNGPKEYAAVFQTPLAVISSAIGLDPACVLSDKQETLDPWSTYFWLKAFDSKLDRLPIFKSVTELQADSCPFINDDNFNLIISRFPNIKKVYIGNNQLSDKTLAESPVSVICRQPIVSQEELSSRCLNDLDHNITCLVGNQPIIINDLLWRTRNPYWQLIRSPGQPFAFPLNNIQLSLNPEAIDETSVDLISDDATKCAIIALKSFIEGDKFLSPENLEATKGLLVVSDIFKVHELRDRAEMILLTLVNNINYLEMMKISENFGLRSLYNKCQSIELH